MKTKKEDINKEIKYLFIKENFEKYLEDKNYLEFKENIKYIKGE